MSVGSIGLSFWQQDQNYWSNAQSEDNSQSQIDALINLMGNAMTTESQGLASIANQTALSRVNTQLTAAVQSALQGSTGSATASSSSSNPTASSSAPDSASSAAPAAASHAIGTGTVPLTATTTLFTLGILKGGTISVSDDTGTTTYTSTGTDTVNDVINAINANLYGHASAAAWLNSSGQLVITGKNTTDLITIGGTYAANIGFGAANNSFAPTAPSPASSASSASNTSSTSASSNTPTVSSSSGGSSGSSGSSSATAKTAVSAIAYNSATALLSSGTAETLLASSGLGGNLINLLA
jgi:hypothetical protein